MIEELSPIDIHITKERLEISEAQLKNAQHLARLGSWEWDIPANNVTWSDELYCIYGIDPQVFGGTYEAVLELIHPDDRASFDAAIQKAFLEHESYLFEHRIIRPDGSLRILQARGAVVVDELDQVIRIFGTGQDITERKHFEDDLCASESFRQMVVRSERECVKLVAPDCTLLDINPAGLAMVEANCREEVVGQSILSLVVPELRTSFKELNERVFSGETAIGEFEIIGLKGTRRWVETHAAPLRNSAAEVIAQLAITRDISERKRSEEALRNAERKYRDIFENAIAGIFQSTPEGQYIAANPAFARMHGFDSPEELIRKRTDIRRETYVDPQRREEFERLLEAHGVVRGFEHQLLRKDGSKIWVSVNARAVRDNHGVIQYYEGTAHDISERKRAEARSAAFATLARKLGGARTQLEAGRIIAETGQELFGWDAFNLDLYDSDLDLVQPMLNVDTINGQQIESAPSVLSCKPTAKSRRVINRGPELILREEPVAFDQDSIPFGDKTRPSASLMAVPIRHASTIIGLLAIQSYSLKAYDEIALKDFEALADHCGEALNRIRAEQSLHESEERFQQMAENFEDIVWMTDRYMRKVLYINPAYEKVCGRASDDLYESFASELEAVHPDDRQSVEEALERQRHDEQEPLEYRIVRPDGSVRWILRRSFPIRNNDGEIYRIAGIAQDITNRKQAEDDLRKQKEILQKIFDYTPMMVAFIGADGRMQLVNRQWERTLGWSLEEVQRGNLDVFTEMYPEPAYRASVLNYIAEGGAEWTDFKTRISDGRVIYTTWANVLLSDGTSICIGKDITAQKQAEAELRESEERYRDLVESSEELICTHDLEGRILSANRAAAAALGYEPKDYAKKKNLREILAPEVRDGFDDYVARLQSKGFDKGLMLVQTSTGERRIWEYYNTLRTEGVPAPIVRGMAHDITDRQRAEKERKVISEVIESVSLTTNLDELLKLVHQSLKKVIYAENCLVALYDKELDQFSHPFHVDQRSACPPPRELMKGPTAYVFRTGVPYLMTAEKSQTLIDQGQVELIGPPAKAWLGVPLKTPVETIGVLVVQHHERVDAYNQRDLEFLSSVGSELALAIERKRTEAALRESEERYRELFENARDAIYVHDLNGIYTSVNRGAEILAGYSRADLLGKNFTAFVAPEHLKQVQQHMWKKLSDQGETIYEMDIIARDGRRVPVEVSSRMIYKNGVPLGIQGMARDITERKRNQEALLGYSRRLIDAQEAERQRIARELHDQIGQVLTAVQFNLQFLQRLCSEAKCQSHIQDSLSVLDDALHQVRDLSFDLRPSMLDDLGLIPALRWYLSRQTRLTGLSVEFITELQDHSVRFGLELETACFRIAQEAVTNVARHADAKRVSVQLQRVERDLLLIVDDDGEGFDIDAMDQRAPRATLGLQGMLERAHAVGGTIEIDSEVSKGTIIRARFPIRLN